MSSRIEKRVADSLERLPEKERPEIHGEFIWPSGISPDNYRKFRPTPSGQRPRGVDEIPPEEAANAAAAALEHNLAMPEEELYREVASAFGFAQLGKNLKEFGKVAVDVLVEQDRALRDNKMIRKQNGEGD